MPTLSSDQEAQLRRLLEVFLRHNQQLNLSALRSPSHCWIGNVLDSLAFLEIAPAIFGKNWQEQKPRILDIGIGGGFPLLPLAIMMPEAQFVGVDAVRKKVDAVEEMVRELELKNVQVLPARAEELARSLEHRALYDVILSRAVAPISVLLEYCVPFLKVHGRCVVWKSLHIAKELEQAAKARRLLSAHLTDMHTYTLPEDFGERQLVVFEKQQPTGEEFPRRVGVPMQKPLR